MDNPLCGPRGASAVFGPQKGRRRRPSKRWIRRFPILPSAKTATGRDAAERLAGAAAVWAPDCCSYQRPTRPGVEIVLEAVGFADVVRDADFVITGEGRTDFQTAFGKAPVGLPRSPSSSACRCSASPVAWAREQTTSWRTASTRR